MTRMSDFFFDLVRLYYKQDAGNIYLLSLKKSNFVKSNEIVFNPPSNLFENIVDETKKVFLSNLIEIGIFREPVEEYDVLMKENGYAFNENESPDTPLLRVKLPKGELYNEHMMKIKVVNTIDFLVIKYCGLRNKMFMENKKYEEPVVEKINASV